MYRDGCGFVLGLVCRAVAVTDLQRRAVLCCWKTYHAYRRKRLLLCAPVVLKCPRQGARALEFVADAMRVTEILGCLLEERNMGNTNLRGTVANGRQQASKTWQLAAGSVTSDVLAMASAHITAPQAKRLGPRLQLAIRIERMRFLWPHETAEALHKDRASDG